MAIEIKIKRTWKTEKSTIGLLYFYDELGDSTFRCFTLEDVERNKKIFNETAIPKGRFKVGSTWSTKLTRQVFMLENVPNFERIYLHAGNAPDDTSGCILCGYIRKPNRIERSRDAVAAVYELIQAAMDKGQEVFVTVDS